MRHLKAHHEGHWGVTLKPRLIRLNSGWVESLVLYRDGLRVLVERESVPAGTVFEEDSAPGESWDPYVLAPGCRIVSLSHDELAGTLQHLLDAHHAAMSIAGRRKPQPGILRAHSPGIELYLDQVLNQPAPGAPTHQRERFIEGQQRDLVVSRYERDQRARQACLAHHGTSCSVCGMSFQERYGDSMKGFIHVHHLTPLSHIGEEYEVDPVRDLVPVCPNCHEFLHGSDPPLHPDEARSRLRSG